MLRTCNFAPGEYYHVYNRGNSKQKIFHDKEDYERFIKLLYICNDQQKVVLKDLRENVFKITKIKEKVNILAYCIMPNHFHILLEEKESEGVTTFMQKISTAYAMYYNKKYNRTGSLFEGKFKAKHMGTDNQIKYLFSYIHLNPVKLISPDWKEKGIKNKAKIFTWLHSYAYSSYVDYLNQKRDQNVILNYSLFEKFIGQKNLEKELTTWFNYNENIF